MGKVKDTLLNKYGIRNIIITSFCVVIALIMLKVMLTDYSPSQNSLEALSSVCMDVICILILFIIKGSFVYGHYDTNRTTKVFIALIVATIWALFLDFLNWAYDGSLEFGSLTFWYTLGSLCMGSVLAALFSIYLCSYMEEIHNLGSMRMSAEVCIGMNVISFVLTFVLAITRTAFDFVDGHYVTGTFYNIVTVIPILTILYLTCFAIFSVRKIGLHDVVAVTGYILFMIAGALIEATFGIGTTYVSVTIANIFIFVMLQNEIIAKEKINVQKWMKKSRTDELTGFYNRHAYENDMSILESDTVERNFVYLSVDVNSLKDVNDSFGHNAGDELLVGAAECLDKCFGPYGKLYRIGGDEFIGLIYMDEAHLSKSKKYIQEVTDNWSGELVKKLTISCGYVTKAEAEDMNVRQMAVLADKRMYLAKNEYYRSLGIERRMIEI